MEIILHPEDDFHPPEYPAMYLHKSLTPTFRDSDFNNGNYERVYGKQNAFYMYTFEKNFSCK